jgi:hypothetical protein
MAAEEGKNVESFALGLILAVLVYLLLNREFRKLGFASSRGRAAEIGAGGAGGRGGNSSGGAGGGGCGCLPCSGGAATPPNVPLFQSPTYEPPISIGGQSYSNYPSGPGTSPNRGGGFSGTTSVASGNTGEW